MKISTILDHIDNGHIALPEFQRGYVWNRNQVRGLMDSLYRGHPVGGLLVWATESVTADRRGKSPTIARGIVKLLLDGQQRMTSIYGIVRGKPPEFFEGNKRAFTDLRFHLPTEVFQFYQPIKMRDDPMWIDVSALMKAGNGGLGIIIQQLFANPEYADQVSEFVSRLNQLLGITEIDLHIEEVTGKDKTIDVVVDIFNRVNSGGTKLSKGDLALAKICAEWPEARDSMTAKLKVWADAGYDFTLDWLLRSINTVLTGEAKFSYLHDKGKPDIQDGLRRASKHIDILLDLISGRLGLDHNRVFFGRFGVPIMVRYLDLQRTRLSARERDKLLFWYVQAGMWGRFSASTETAIDRGLAALEGSDDGLDALIEELSFWHGSLRVEASNFTGWSLGARFYPVLYMLTRMGQACDWGTGLPLKADMLGKMNRLEVHHIFPKSKLYASKPPFNRTQVNALANFCFLTKYTNLVIGSRFPEDYFPEVEQNHPGALASQWIPMDPNLWKMENYLDFLEARRILLAEEANRRFSELLHGDNKWVADASPISATATQAPIGGISSEAEERELEALNGWVDKQDLPRGQVAYDYADAETGEQRAVFDLAWPDGLQPGLTGPVAVLLNEGADVLALASSAGFRCFTTAASFRKYVDSEVIEK